MSQPYISAGIDRFGGMVGGGIAFNFSDMLGNHNLYAQVSADTYGGSAGDIAKNTGVFLGYTNMSKRWNWGFAVEQSPYIAGGYATALGTVNGEPAVLDQTIIQRQVNRGFSGMVAYPFSTTARVEFTGGFTRSSYDEQIRTTSISRRTGRVLDDSTVTNPLAEALNMSSFSTALVTDSSLFGATSPVAGRRSRFEISPTFGDLQLTSALADYRHYFMPARFYTIAVRGMHYGRYGTGAEDSRLMPLFLGYPEFVRGYGVDSFSAGECGTGSSCPTYDQLVGSRMLVGNIELRFPLLRPFGVSDRMYGPLPVEVAFFLDGGVTWNRGQKALILQRRHPRARDERRHHAAHEPARLRDRANRLCAAVRPSRTRVDLELFADAWILTRERRERAKSREQRANAGSLLSALFAFLLRSPVRVSETE